MLALPLCGASAQGADPSANQWQLAFTPYAWTPFLVGDQTIKGRTVSIDIDPIEVLEHLERVPWMSYAEARNGPLAIYNDTFYAMLGADATASRTFGVVGASASLGVDFEQAIIEVGGAYEIWRRPKAEAGATAIDLLGGARYWHQRMDLNLDLAATVNVAGLDIRVDRAVARSGSVDWVDPVVGLRLRQGLAPGQDLVLRGDVGGFGAGSDFSWNALAAYSFNVAQADGVTYSGVLGYRALYVDYEDGAGIDRYEYDVLMHGPISGLSVRF